MNTKRNYELVYILRPNLEDEAREAVFNKVKGIIESDGQVDKVDTWGNRRLAYPIKKLNEGFYNLVYFTATSEVVNEIDRNLKIMDAVIRHMMVRQDEK
ncbi:small subunit ribosomal protein S6 [Peptoclostridium litorale DSM 5388]|uniref:Small ribosomal subunit protein bS6 n=1 Tax=Peptoclostridium litorale DSM 5388 TaxID=1121324 RepID=A0A069RH46_PEPLI|nr:30S ribosomal protein S6 [Peptoclostridium litorale]KDR96364.1 30S ribosomal protein S6 [Peptoclostridium litorale DSM 5388]SIO27034.1 small subunit ribosomal protein S6 [Peptoclostridium litorale DSM 5388]